MFRFYFTYIVFRVSKGEDLKKEIQQLMASMFPDWFDMDHNLKLQRLSGAMTK
jgi:hypothetical protein